MNYVIRINDGTYKNKMYQLEENKIPPNKIPK